MTINDIPIMLFCAIATTFFGYGLLIGVVLESVKHNNENSHAGKIGLLLTLTGAIFLVISNL